MKKEKIYKLIILILVLVILILGTFIIVDMSKKKANDSEKIDNCKEVENDNEIEEKEIFNEGYSMGVIEREVGDDYWPVTTRRNTYDLYVAAEEKGNSVVIKGKIVNKSDKEIKRLLLVKYNVNGGSLTTTPVQGKEVLLGSDDTTKTVEFEFSFSTANLSASQKLAMIFKINVLEDGSDYQYIYYN